MNPRDNVINEDCTDKYIKLFNSHKTDFTWDRVSESTFMDYEDEIYACKNIPIKNKLFEFNQENSIQNILYEINNNFNGKHLYIYKIIETPRMIVPAEQRHTIKLTNQTITVPIYNPYMFEEQEVTVDKALIIKGVVIKAAIKGSKDKIFKGTKAEIKEYLTKELNIVEYPKDGIIQEPGNYELQDTKIDQQLNSDISNPTQIFYMKARLDEYKLIIMTVVSIPVYIKE